MPSTPTVTQLFESEKVKYSPETSRALEASVQYKVMDASSEAEVISAAAEAIPSQTYGIGLRNIEITERLAPDGWKVQANYQASQSSMTHEGTPEEIVSYSNVMHQTRRYQSLFTKAQYTASGIDAVDYHGQIDVQDGAAQGVDVYFPVATMNISHFYKKAQMTPDLRNRIVRQLPVSNIAPFRGFQAGELLFGGANIQQESGGKFWRVDYTFLISPNDPDVVIQGWTGGTIEKDGWDALWIAYKESSHGTGEKRPSQVNIERVYYSINFAEAFGLSARG